MMPRTETSGRRLLRRGAGRGLVVALTLIGGAVWADGLLRVSRRAAEVVLSPEDLQALQISSLEDDASPPAADEQRVAAEEAEPAQPHDEGGPPVPEPAPPADLPPSDNPPVEASAVAEPRPTEFDEPAAPAERAAPDEAEAAALAESDAAPPVDTEPQFGSAGTLQSFAGDAPGSSDGSADAAGSGDRPAWLIHFRRAYDARQLSAAPQTRLAAVRQRPGYIECLLIEGRQLGVPQTIDQLLARHPQFSHRRGILLPRAWFREWDERLLPLGGGWQFWLLVDNQLFSSWIARLEPQLAAAGLPWEQVERVEAQLELSGPAAAPAWRLDVQRIGQRVPPGATGLMETDTNGFPSRRDGSQ